VSRWFGDRARSVLLGMAGIAVLMVVWEATVRAFAIPHYILPSMSGILATTAAEWRTLVAAAAMTVFEVIAGLGLGALIGVAVAILLVVVPRAKGLVLPPLVALNSVPSVAYAPLAQLWFGVGPEGKIFMVAFVVSYTILLNTLDGLERVDSAAINLLKSWRRQAPSCGGSGCRRRRRPRRPASTSRWSRHDHRCRHRMLGAYRGLGWIIFQSLSRSTSLAIGPPCSPHRSPACCYSPS
jgi:NitT/TauT family transport system permease protein